MNDDPSTLAQVLVYTFMFVWLVFVFIFADRFIDPIIKKILGVKYTRHVTYKDDVKPAKYIHLLRGTKIWVKNDKGVYQQSFFLALLVSIIHIILFFGGTIAFSWVVYDLLSL